MKTSQDVAKHHGENSERYFKPSSTKNFIGVEEYDIYPTLMIDKIQLFITKKHYWKSSLKPNYLLILYILLWYHDK